MAMDCLISQAPQLTSFSQDQLPLMLCEDEAQPNPTAWGSFTCLGDKYKVQGSQGDPALQFHPPTTTSLAPSPAL